MNATQTKSPTSGLIASDEMDLLLSGAPSDVEQKRAALAAILSRALVKNIKNVEAHAALVAALECQEALESKSISQDETFEILRSHGWKNGLPLKFVQELRRAALAQAKQ